MTAVFSYNALMLKNIVNDDDKMAWPILGEVLMPYSIDSPIYDKTLDTHRKNETLCIAAQKNDIVHAAADGQVTDISNSRELGTAMIIDHGNGWLTTYSQLSTETIVQIGDTVYKGDPIAYVGDPSIYSVLLGSHLGFMVTKDGESVDPNIICID